MTVFSKSGASMLWILLLTATSTVTTLALGCATPFPSLAALAAVHMRRRDGIATMLLAWAASQAVGFGVLRYPHDPRTIAWGLALGIGAVGSLLAAGTLLQRFAHAPVWARLAIAYVAGFLGYKLALLASAFVLGGVHTAIDPMIMANQFVRNAAILAGLYALYRGLLALGVPAAPVEATT